jgi:hypothetical protein
MIAPDELTALAAGGGEVGPVSWAGNVVGR